MLLEISVGDFAQAIVRRGHRLFHRVGRARIVEAGQEGQRPEADEAVGVFADRLQQRRHRLRDGRAADRAAGGHAGGVVEIAELVDGGADLSGEAGVGPRSCADAGAITNNE